MRVASVAGYLFLALLAFFAVGCVGDPEQPIAELTEADEETSPSASSPESEGLSDLSAETTSAAVAEPSIGDETPSPAGQVAQQVAEQATGFDAKDVYVRAVQAFRAADKPASCKPTQQDMLGSFYVPDAPEQTSVGSGYVLSGAVSSIGSCEPIRNARTEFWLTNPGGVYDDAHRATVPVGSGGEYRFESNVPGSYEDRPPHAHLWVTAPGYRELVTQPYPNAGQKEGNFDLILEPV